MIYKTIEIINTRVVLTKRLVYVSIVKKVDTLSDCVYANFYTTVIRRS